MVPALAYFNPPRPESQARVRGGRALRDRYGASFTKKSGRRASHYVNQQPEIATLLGNVKADFCCCPPRDHLGKPQESGQCTSRHLCARRRAQSDRIFRHHPKSIDTLTCRAGLLPSRRLINGTSRHPPVMDGSRHQSPAQLRDHGPGLAGTFCHAVAHWFTCG